MSWWLMFMVWLSVTMFSLEMLWGPGHPRKMRLLGAISLGVTCGLAGMALVNGWVEP